MQEITQKEIKGYELVERIGTGGFGAVYRAHQSTVGREVAIKVILPGHANQPEFIRRFEAEAQLVARLEHHYIVPLYDYWRDPEGAYLVMRWLRGGSLFDQIQNHGALSIEDATSMVDQIAGALHTAHRSQVIHRDIKPGNILLDEDGNAFVADFGIAKDHAVAKGVTEVDAIVGSPDYLSPEQARSEAVTPQTDIYSLGVVLYEMLEGKHPFPGLSPIERLYKHINEPLPDVDSIDTMVKDAVNDVIQKATAKDPMQRFKDVMEMAQALRKAARLDDSTVGTTLVELLTPREQEVLNLVIAGKSNREIADLLVLTLATVKTYINKIYRKLNVRSRVQAIVKARELDLIVHRSDASDSSIMQLPEPENPYKGLRAFQPADAQDFFGREKLTRKLLRRLQEDVAYRRFLAVVGPSGSGKSSVVKAGLIPALWRGELSGSDNWYIVDFLPGRHPLDELEVALAKIASQGVGNLNEHLSRDERGLVRAANIILPDDESELLIVIDQFEEIFTLTDDEHERKQFLDLLRYASTDSRSKVRVVVTLRADYYDRPLQLPDFGMLIKERTETVLPLNADELEHAIRQPARHQSVTFEDGLVSKIVTDVHYQPGALPLLQYALTELFEKREGHLLTHAAYIDMGKATGALAKRAEELFHEYDTTGQGYIRQLFLRLVTLGEGTDDTRRRASRSELLELSTEHDVIDEIIDTFVVHHLFSVNTDPATRHPTVEVAHEALLKEWQGLASWLIESRDDIRSQQQVSMLSKDWVDASHDNSFLLRGSRLAQFEAWSQQTELTLTPYEQTYLRACIANRDKEIAVEQEQQEREYRLEKRARNFLIGLVAVLSIATVVSVTFAGIAQKNEARANLNANISQSLALASGAQASLSDGNVEQALALAVRANRFEEPPVFSQTTLYEVAFTPATQYIINAGDEWHFDVVLSPDGTMVAANEDGVKVTIWDVNTRAVLMYLDGEHIEGLSGMVFTPDSQRLLSTAWDDSLELWDINTGEMVWQSVNPAGDPNSVDISPDGRLAIVASEQGLATLWDMQTGEFLGELAGHDIAAQVMGIAISPDGRLVATASEDATVIIWDIDTREPIHRLEGHNSIIFSVDFSPDGITLASSGFDNTVILWDVATGEIIRQLEGHTDFVFDVDWSPDGSRLLSASRDSTLILWDAEIGTHIHTYRDEAGRSFTASFIDDTHAVSGGSSGNIRFWSLYDEREQQRIDLFGETINSMVISDDGTFSAIGLQDEIVLMDMRTSTEIQRLSYDGGAVTSLALTSDARILISGFEDNSTIMWDVASGDEIRRLEGHTSIVVNDTVEFSRILDIAVSSDGQQALSGAEDRTMLIWDINTGDIIHRFESCSDTINTGAFSSDGQYIAGGFGTLSEPTRGSCPESNFSIHLWDAETGELVRQFEGHADAVVRVRFSPDGRWLLSGSIDETVRLWDVQSGEELQRFVGHTGGVVSIDFSSDGRYIVSGASDGSVHVWDTHTGDLLRQLIGHTGQVNSVEFVNDAYNIWSSSDDGSVRLWLTMLDRDDLLGWVSENRYIRELTCSELRLYLIVDVCD